MPAARGVRWAKFRVSVVCLVAVAILCTLISLLTGGSLLERHATLYLYIPDATGLGQGAAVRVDGIGVGKVQEVRLTGSTQPNRVVKVTLKVERARLASISSDSYAQIGAETMIGDMFVDISSGRSPGHIPPNGEIPYKPDVDLLKTLDMHQFEEQLRALEAVVSDIEQGRGLVGQFVVGEDMYNDLRRELSKLEREIHVAARTTGSVGQALYSDLAYRKLTDPLLELDRSLARLQSGQGDAGQFLRDSAQYDQLRSGVASLRGSIADLRKADFMSSDRAYAGWSRQVEAMIQKVDAVNAGPLMTTSEMYDSLNGAAKEMRDTLHDFRVDPRKYMRLKLF